MEIKTDKRLKRKLPKNYPAWKLDALMEEMQELKKRINYLKNVAIQEPLTIYSASETEYCIGMRNSKWHKIVCNYEGDRCIGSPREHWQSTWDIREDGFHLRSMHKDFKGWHGQYNKDNELKFDELPRDILNLHHKVLVEHLKNLSIWYPCHIYNDFTGELYRP